MSLLTVSARRRTAAAAIAVLSAVPCAPALASALIVLNSNDDSMSVIDAARFEELRRVPIGKGPHHLVPMPDTGQLVIGNTLSNSLTIVEATSGAIVRTVPRIADPYHLGFSPDGRWFVVNANRQDRVDVYSYARGEFTLAGRVDMPRTPSHMAFDHSGNVYVTLQDSNRVAAIELATRATRWIVDTGPLPAGIWLTPDGEHLLVAATGADFVDVLRVSDGARVKRLRTGAGAHNFLPLGDARRVLLTNRVANTISIIDQQALAVVEEFPVAGGPDDMELRAGGNELWVTSRWQNRVSIVDMRTRKVTRTIKVGRSPHGLYIADHAPRR